MKLQKPFFLLFVLFCAPLVLSGCLESTDAKRFQPGVYQGAADPLIGNSDTAALQARFKKQMDR